MPKRKAKRATKQSNSSRCDLATNGAPEENVIIHQEVMDKKVRVRWTNEVIKCFLETCLEEVDKVGRNGGSLRRESWAKLATKLDEVCHLKLTQKQLKNQFDYLKGKYSGWVYLRNRTGNIYDPKTNMFDLSNQEWEDLCKGHPKAKIVRASPLLFSELCIALFEGTFVTSSHVYAPSSTRERILISSSSSFTPHIHTTQKEDEDVKEEGHTYGKRCQEPNVDKSSANPSNDEEPSAPSSRSKKKSKTKVDLDELALEIKNALDILVSRQTSNLNACQQTSNQNACQQTLNLNACLDRLNTLGLDPRDPLHCAAIDIFGHTTLLRETWLMIPPEPDILTNWISRTARRLGFMK